MSIAKLAERMKKDRCIHCGVKHASDGSCGCSDRRYGQPRQAAKDADRRRPATDYSPAKMAEDEKLRSSTMDALIPLIGSGSPLLAGAVGSYDAPEDHGWSHFWRTWLGATAGQGAGHMLGSLTGHKAPAAVAAALGGAAGSHLGRRAALERELKELASGSKKESSARSQIDLLRQKIAVAPLLAAGGAALGRVAASGAARHIAGNVIGGAAMQGGMNMMAPKTPA